MKPVSLHQAPIEYQRDIVEGLIRENMPELEVSNAARELGRHAANFGCQSDTIRQILEIISGEKILSQSNSRPQFSLIVVTDNPNGHNYPHNVPIPVITDDGTYGLLPQDKDGVRAGNQLPNRSSGAWRFCTKEEVDAFIESMTDDMVHAIAQRYPT